METKPWRHSGPPEREPPPEQFRIANETEFSLAEKFLAVAEEGGSMIDELKESLESGSLTTSHITETSIQARNLILKRACTILKLSDRARHYAIFGDIPEEE